MTEYTRVLWRSTPTSNQPSPTPTPRLVATPLSIGNRTRVCCKVVRCAGWPGGGRVARARATKESVPSGAVAEADKRPARSARPAAPWLPALASGSRTAGVDTRQRERGGWVVEVGWSLAVHAYPVTCDRVRLTSTFTLFLSFLTPVAVPRLQLQGPWSRAHSPASTPPAQWLGTHLNIPHTYQ